MAMLSQPRAGGRGGALVLALVLMAVTLRLVQVMARYPLPLGHDGWAYLAAARALSAGLNPIGPDLTSFLPEAGRTVPTYLYPPVLAALLLPLAGASFAAAQTIWLAVVSGASLLLIPLLRHFVGWRVAAVAVLGFVPVWESIWLGQINALIACLLLLALLALERERLGAAGAWLALGALLKITPAVALATLLLRGAWRGVLAAAAVALAALLLSLPLIGPGGWLTGILATLTLPLDHPALISWTARLGRWLGAPGTWLGLLLTVALLGATLLRARATPPLLALAAAIILPLLIARITWNHHAVMALPALAVLWRWGPQGRTAAAASWLAITLVSGLATLLVLTACWAMCCWPRLLRLIPEHPPLRAWLGDGWAALWRARRG